MRDAEAIYAAIERKRRLKSLGLGAIALVVIGAIGGLIVLLVILPESATESYERRKAALVGEWMIGLDGEHDAAARWIGAESLAEGDYEFYDYLRFDDDESYLHSTMLFRGGVCFALVESGRWDPDRDSERDYIQFTPRSSDFGCYRLESGQELHLMRGVALVVLDYLAKDKPWDLQRDAEPNIAMLESLAHSRTAYTIEMDSINDRVLELDLNEGTPTKRRYRAYKRINISRSG